MGPQIGYLRLFLLLQAVLRVTVMLKHGLALAARG